MSRLARCLLIAGGTPSLAAVLSVTPVQKVIQTLTEMKSKGVVEMEQEQKTFQKYSEFVIGRTRELNHEIETAKASIEELIAVASKADSDVASLGEQVKQLDSETDALESQKKSATDLRETEHAQFLQQQTDYEESLYALDRAIQTLEAQNYDRAQAMMLLQKMAKSVRGMHRVLAGLALVQEESHDDWSPAVAAYEFQSSGIVDMLKTMRDRFQKELGELEKGEMNAAHACDMEVVHLTNTIAQMKAEREDAAAAKAENAELSARTKGELADTKISLADAEQFLADLKATFESKKATFEENQQVRKDELAALAKAVEILSSPDVSESYSEHVKFLQGSVSMLQMGSASRRIAARNQATDFLTRQAKLLNSKNLATLVSTLDANPFAKVIDMIKSLLEKLKEEAAEEADHKAWCDEELKKNKQKRTKKESDVARLNAEIEQKIVAIEKMGKQIETLAAEQAELTQAMSDATSQRNTEKEENTEAIKDAKNGQVAVKQAIVVLKEFYEKHALVQLSVRQVPEMESYKGMQRTQGGILGMLEVIESDFARVEADTTAAEHQAAAEYKRFMDDAKADKKAKHDAEFKLSLEKDQAEYEQEQAQKDLDATQKQLDMANQYFEELKPQCVEVQVSYKDRAARRKEEIAALKQAYKILNGEASA